MIINRYPSTWLKDLHESLIELRTEYPEAHIYALIEGVHDESCYPFLRRTASLSYAALYQDTPSADEETLCVSPLLVEYQAEDCAAWDKLMTKTDGTPSLSIIVTMESLDALARRLMPWCVVDAAGYTLALSFADTRILPELTKVLTPPQRELLCGPMLRWQYVARDAKWEMLSLPGSDAPAADKVTLDENQCARLTDAAEADNVLFRLRSISAGSVDCHSPARTYALVRHWLACADHAQINSPLTRMEICEFGLMHPGLESSPTIMSWLETPVAPESFENLRERLLAAHSRT